MSQRLRRNIAPVLGALALLALGLAVWAALGAHRTETVTAALRAEFRPGASPWEFEPPADGYAVFVYRSGETVCATLSLQPEAATLLHPPSPARTAARAGFEELLAEVAPLAAGCDTIDVRVFASRMPYHGRFEVRYAGAAVRSVGEPRFEH